MLGKRYENDGKPALPLNSLQIEQKKQIELKFAKDIYQFESVPCAVCNSKDFETLSQKDRYGLPIHIVICRQCGLIQTNPRMTQESYNDFYNYEYRKFYSGKESPDDEFFYEQYRRGIKIYSFLEKKGVFSKPPSELFVFEIGCGAGGILQYFRKRGCRVQGIDLGEEYLAFGKERYGLNLSVGTIADTSLDQTPDIIISSHILEHILSPKGELAYINRILSPNGVIYIEVPGVKNLMNSYEMDFLRMLHHAHTYHFTLTTLRNLIETNGFQMVYGDEIIRSIFKKTDLIFSNAILKNDYEPAMVYLNKLERLKDLLPFPPYKLKQLPEKIIIRILKVFGVWRVAKRVYWKLKGEGCMK